jgi:hypothetical protein
MAKRESRTSTRVGGDVTGQVAIGRDIFLEYHSTQTTVEVTSEDREEVRALLETLRRRVLDEVEDDDQPAALERVAELEKAVVAEQPKISTMEYVKDWFLDNVPRLGGAVTSLILSPVVGKIVEAGGEVVSAEFKRRFGHLGNP